MIDFDDILDTCPNLRHSHVAVVADTEAEFLLDTARTAQMNAQAAEQFARLIAPLAYWERNYDAQTRQGVIGLSAYVFSRGMLRELLEIVYRQGFDDGIEDAIETVREVRETPDSRELSYLSAYEEACDDALVELEASARRVTATDRTNPPPPAQTH